MENAETETNTAAAAAPEEQAAPTGDTPTTRAPEQKLCDIGGGVKVPLIPLLAMRNPNCRHCRDSNGWVTFVEGDVRVPRVCACAVERFRKRDEHRKKTIASHGDIKAAPYQPGQRERVERRLGRLGQEVARLEADMAERKKVFDESILHLDMTSKGHRTAEQDLASEIVRRTADIDDKRAELVAAERRVSELREAIKGETESIAQAEQAKALAVAMFEDTRREMNRRHVEFERSTSRLRKEISKAQARLARARIYGDAVGAEEASDGETL